MIVNPPAQLTRSDEPHAMPMNPLIREIGKWALLCLMLSVLTGSACAFFLWSLEQLTRLHAIHPDLLWGLPAAGMAIGWLSSRVGPEINSGNKLLIREIRHREHGVPILMAPFVLTATLLTHLFGGPAGREGTAVQMGGSIAGGLARLIPGISDRDMRVLLMAGIAAGFGGVFGTPMAGAIFALELAALGRLETRAVLPCLAAAILSDVVCDAWGIHHTSYVVESLVHPAAALRLTPLSGRLILGCVVGGVLFGLTARLFVGMTHTVQRLFSQWIKLPLLRPVVGGFLVIALVYLTGSRDFLGLGVSSADPSAVTIVRAFQPGGIPTWSWWWKLVFTAVTLGSGFKGGEATPLFFVGATLGHVLGVCLGIPVDLMAAMGFAAVFAGTTHTPIACSVMAGELFGAESIMYFTASCLIANHFSGAGVYPAQQSDAGISPPRDPDKAPQ
jgi:H+/Cl- antiporter ClcA